MDVKEEVRIRNAYRRTAPCLVAEIVGDTVLDAVCHKTGVVEFLASDRGIDGKSIIDAHIFAPVDLTDDVIEILGIVSRKFLDRLQDAQRGAQTDVSLIHQRLVAVKRDHAVSRLHILGA